MKFYIYLMLVLQFSSQTKALFLALSESFSCRFMGVFLRVMDIKWVFINKVKPIPICKDKKIIGFFNGICRSMEDAF